MRGLRGTMGSQSRASNPTLGAAYGDSRRKWRLVQVAPNDKWKAGEMGVRGAEGLHVC